MRAHACVRQCKITEGFQLPPDIDNYSFKQRDQIIKKESIFSYEKGSLRKTQIK